MSHLVMAVVTADPLNVRSDPSTDNPRIAQLEKGQWVQVTDNDGSWSQILYGDGSGYVDTSYLDFRTSLLLVDASHYQDNPDWTTLAADTDFHGAIIKATDGTSYSYAVDWFPGQWQAILDANPDRYGSSWFRGCYHYLEMKDDPVEQAKYYLSTIEKAGGWSLSPKGDLLPIVDVEWNSPGSAQQLIEYTSAWSATIKTELGCETILYGRNAMSESNPPINSRMGCSYLWNPSYTASMPSTEDIGWPDDRVKLWQYTDGSSPRSAWPNKVPGMTGLCDINRFLGDSLDDLKSLCF